MELEHWIAQQRARSVAAMEQALSAIHLRRRRDSFGQVIRPAAGSVLASPVIANWDPEPDYFFHWLRDSAIAMRTVAELLQDAADETQRARWRRHFEDFVHFSLMLTQHDSSDCHTTLPVRESPAMCTSEFLRPTTEICALSGDALLAEPRFNPDGSIDIFRWSRPQYDGPALRALACIRYLAAGGAHSAEVDRLLRIDLDFTVRHAGLPCIGPWEEPEQKARHYYVELVQLSALVHGRPWVSECRAAWTAAEQKLRDDLEEYWSERYEVLLPLLPASGELAVDLLDASTLVAVWDADLPDGRHNMHDQRVRKTQAAIEQLFAREFPINRERQHAPVLGRSRGDRYFGGGAWYPTTLASIGLYYRLAQCSAHDRHALIGRGDAFMVTLRNLIPSDGALSEQVDRCTGAQTSARHLTWSYAAFISAARARERALAPV